MGVDLKKIKKLNKKYKKEANKYKPLIIKKNDVIFNMNSANFSIWKGVRTSKMCRDHEGRKILYWLLDKSFNEDALEIIQEQLDELYL